MFHITKGFQAPKFSGKGVDYPEFIREFEIFWQKIAIGGSASDKEKLQGFARFVKFSDKATMVNEANHGKLCGTSFSFDL